MSKYDVSRQNLSRQIRDEIQECIDELAEAGTTYSAVLNNEDTTGYGLEGENNNFTAGRISGLIRALNIRGETYDWS